MNTILILFFLIVLLIFFIFIERGILNPPVILTVVWILPFLWLLISEKGLIFRNDIGSLAVVLFPAGIILFFIGYLIAFPSRARAEDININVSYISMSVWMKLFIVIEILITTYHVYDVISYSMSHYVNNIWYSYKYAKDLGLYNERWFIPYFRTASRILICVTFSSLFTGKYNKKDKKWIFAQGILTFLMHFLGPGRNELFAVLIPLGLIYLFVKSTSIVDSLKKAGLVGCVLLIAFFAFFSLKVTDEAVRVGVTASNSFLKYLCGGPISFIDWAEEKGHVYGNGLYTFRFFCAIFNALGFNLKVVSIVEPFRIFLDNLNGNVYTVYKWYANDFGVVYAVIMQGIFGFIHGKIAKNYFQKKNVKSMVIYSISFFPLFMQFFDDEYISKTSTWIQIAFWIWLFMDTNIFIRYQKENSYKGDRLNG